MIYDTIIVWAWAAGLFSWINLDKKSKKIILEKTEKAWMKVLLSWWERANVSNMDIEPKRDYFTQNKMFLLSIFSRYTNWDIMSFFAENNISIVEEDRSRLILESWDSKELLSCLLNNIKQNNCELRLNSDVKKINKLDNWNFSVTLDWWVKYIWKNVIISSWWKSFSHIWTTWEWYNMARELWLNIVPPYRTLCWMSTKRDFKEISWVSCKVDMKLISKISKKEIYNEKWPILFTHFWISWPIIHNLSNSIWEYLNSMKLEEKDFEKFILDNLSLDITFDIENTPKRLVKFFNLDEENLQVNIELQNWRSWKEAKATGWWIDTNELDNHMQSKKYPGLYFIWEVVDVTWKTWGYNLQWAWSSWFCAAENINKRSN